MKILVITISIALILISAYYLGIVGIKYPLVIENEPIKNGREIIEINNNKFKFDDGKVYEIIFDDARKRKMHIKVGDKLQIGEMIDGKNMILGNVDGWICGTPWAKLIVIPIVPEKVYRNRVEYIGDGFVL